MRRLPLLAGVGLFVFLSASAAQAGGFALREQSTVGLGEAFAGVAAGAAGTSSMFWNPATMTDLPGVRSEWNGTGISPYSRARGLAGSAPAFVGSSTGDLGIDAVIGASYSTYQLNDRLWLGLATNTPFGLTTKPESSFTGRAYGYSTRIASFEAMPTVAYKVNDWLSVGAGARIMYFSASYKSYFSPAGAPALNQVFGLKGDSYGVGYSLGATLTPAPGTEIGIGFRSAVEQDVIGNFSGLNIPPPFNLNPALAAAAATFPSRPVKAKLVLPETLTLGLRQSVTADLTLLAGIEWTNWSRLRYPRVEDRSTGGLYRGLPALTLDYRDGWYFSLGGDYKLDPAWTLRAGLGYEISPITDRTRTLRLPDTDRIWASVGASYAWNDKLNLDISYAHIFPLSDKLNLVQGNPSFSAASGPFVGKINSRVDILSVGLRYRWDDPAKPAPAQMPLVRKG